MNGNRFIPPPEQQASSGAISQMLAEHVEWVFAILLVVLFGIGVGILIAISVIVLGLSIWFPFYVLFRHFYLVKIRRGARRAVKQPGDSGLLVFVMGSGGHTTEMMSMIERSIRPVAGTWRRYVVNEDDSLSEHRIIQLERKLSERFDQIHSDPGRFDIVKVKRARKVHQSWLTTPWSVLQSFRTVKSVFAGLDHQGPFQHPRVVFSNGPATGFIVLAAVHWMKILKQLPDDAANTVYVESWSRVETLSLSGKLIHWLDLADLFVVQWPLVAQRYGKLLARDLVVTPRDPTIPYAEVDEDEDEE